MKRKERYIVRLDEVMLTRGSDYADIDYKEPGVPSTRLQIGPQISGMSDEEIIALFNDTLRAQAQLAAEYKHVAVEVPPLPDIDKGRINNISRVTRQHEVSHDLSVTNLVTNKNFPS